MVFRSHKKTIGAEEGWKISGHGKGGCAATTGYIPEEDTDSERDFKVFWLSPRRGGKMLKID